MATSFNGSLGQTNNYSSITDLITQWPTAAQNQGIELSGIAFDGVVTNYTNPSVIANLTLGTNENPKSGLSYGAPAGIGVPASYSGWFTDVTKTRAEINHDPNTTNPTPSQVLKVKWADNQEITSATIGLSALLPKTSPGVGDQGNEAGVLKLFKDGTQVSATNFTITRLNPPATPKPIVVYPSGVTFIGDRTDGNFTFQIVGDTLTGQTFDELQFSATAYDSPTAAYLASSFKEDSSDYLLRNIQYQGINVPPTPTPTPTPTSPSLFQFAQPNYTVAEGGVVTINVTRTGGTAAASINYATLDGSASSAGTAADYTGATGVLNFAAGQTTANFTVTALTDSIVESPETVNLVLFGGNVSNPSLLTINDVPPIGPTPTPTPTLPSLFQFQQPNYTVAEGGVATINVTRTGGTAAASINYTTVDGSASSPGDYTPVFGTLNFAAGQTTASFTVTALTDSILESPETVNLVLFGGNVGNNPSILTINDVVSTTVAPTPTPTLPSLFQFQQPNYTVAEGGVATINVTRTGDTAAASINYATVDGSASSPGDYTPAAGVLNFAAGQTTASFTVTALTDSILESPETVNLVLFGGNVGSNPSILTINDVVSTTVAPTPTPTLPSLFQFAQPNYTVAEGSPATINVTRTGGTGAATISYATFDGSASSAGTAGDYTSVTGVLNFAAGQTTASFTVPTLTDSIVESPETVNLVLFGGNVSNPSILTINDVATTVAPTPTPTPTPATSTATQFVFSAATFTTPESLGSATVTVNRIGSTTAAASIGYRTLDGTALSTGSAVDYASTAGVLNFGPGQTSTTFNIFVNPDTVPEMTETVNLVLENGPVGTPSTAILQIIDGSGSASGNVFQYSASNYGTIATQGGGTTVTVTRSSGLGAASVDYIILAGTPGTGPAPVYGTDYLLNPGTPTGGTLSFANGQLSQTFTILDNPFTTNNGIVRLGLANPTAGYILGSTAATSITLI
jgi:hypothetical protein